MKLKYKMVVIKNSIATLQSLYFAVLVLGMTAIVAVRLAHHFKKRGWRLKNVKARIVPSGIFETGKMRGLPEK